MIDGEGTVTFRLVKQRSDFAFGFFSGDITNVRFFLSLSILVFFIHIGPFLFLLLAFSVVHEYANEIRLRGDFCPLSRPASPFTKQRFLELSK